MKTYWLPFLVILVAVAAWAGYALLVVQLGREREAYAASLERTEQETLRGESASRLRATVQGTEAEREALERLVRVTILQAVEVIEQAGEAAGAKDVTIGQAAPTSAPKDLSAVSIVVNAGGSFASLMRAVALFEVLPIPASLEQFELEKVGQSDSWRLTAHLRVLLAPQ